MYRTGALKQLDDELAKLNMDLVALQEIRWLGSGVQNRRGSSYDIYYSCHDRHHMLGTGFAVGQRAKSAVIDFKAINDRLCYLRMRGKFHNISLINVHAPTEDKDEEEKDLFYGRLAKLYESCPRYDVKIILGDFNAKVGRESMYRQYIGTHSLHEHSNENGSRLVQFAAASNLVIGSTKFARRDIHKTTWVSPDGATSNQIDHVLINRRHQSSLLNENVVATPDLAGTTKSVDL
ncbi:craniofacial development protein 2-like [Anopheles ziemanni]|uniref:craniofacial development protein 2-like n=1 Tax=Anopheles coustani TaxID=139045 RepID=UPI00265B1C7D|nr:craniofacial development protein 2-like [Anopheles coustani]XP_058123457.1 craniofacial development protein 2-like [Anopheles coustani]XP_058169661.1 craniofacial development protein 2-like [Anopheles ziemanni]XP_058177089.1 craniofacial development protein 2-like [Anopheles ziemanni]XP_058177408.1 craniofacial development protein 2-like [Anopheles ziemanni]XP_058178631.1 craniofacial development protein 2-like [Anopheles ziemanni]